LGDPAVLKDDQKVFSRAILLAEHLKSSASSQLVQLRDSQIMPDKEVARGILGGPVRVFVRASSIDDFADMKLNGEPIGRRLTFLEDSGWIDITGRLRVGNAQASVNELTFVIINGPAGGYGGRFQISAGVQQYDTGPYSVNACPCNKEAFRVVAHLRLLPDHTAQLLDAVFTQGPY
jgi:hypothetical protein